MGCVALHDQCLRPAPDSLIGTCKHTPKSRLNRPCTIDALGTDRCCLRIAVMEQILRGKEIRMCRLRRLLPVCRQLREELVVKGAALRTCKEIVKERRSTFVIAPEQRQIIVHFVSPSAEENTSPLFPIPSRNFLTRG